MVVVALALFAFLSVLVALIGLAYALAVAGGVLVLAVVWLAPRYQARRWTGLERKDAIELEDKRRATMVQLLGSFGLIAAVAVTLYQINDARKASDRTLRLAEEGQASDLFTRAIDQLGARDAKGQPLLEIRLGGISALGRFGRRSANEGLLAGQILAAYIRTNAKSSSRPRPLGHVVQPGLTCDERLSPREDIAQAFNILRDLFPLRRRGRSTRPGIVWNFSDTNLNGVDFSAMNLRGARFENVQLQNTDFSGSDLSRTIFKNVDAQCSTFRFVNLFKSTWRDSDLRSTWFDRPDLDRSVVTDVNLRASTFDAPLFRYSTLARVDLGAAEFWGGRMDRTYLAAVDFRVAKCINFSFNHADLQGSNFHGVQFYDVDFTGVQLLDNDFHGATFDKVKGFPLPK